MWGVGGRHLSHFRETSHIHFPSFSHSRIFLNGIPVFSPGALKCRGNEREAKGIRDTAGKLPGPPPEGKSMDFGSANQTKLCGAPVKGTLYDLAPAIDEYLKAHLFGDIFSRDNLDWRTRELATLAALAAMDGVKTSLPAILQSADITG